MNREAVAEGSQGQARSAAAPGIENEDEPSPGRAIQVSRFSVAPSGLNCLSDWSQGLRRFAPAPGYLLPPLRGSSRAQNDPEF